MLLPSTCCGNKTRNQIGTQTPQTLKREYFLHGTRETSRRAISTALLNCNIISLHLVDFISIKYSIFCLRELSACSEGDHPKVKPVTSNFQKYFAPSPTLQLPQSTQNLAPNSCQRCKPSLANMGTMPHFRSSLPAQVSSKVTGIKCLSHLLKRAVPF